MNDLRTFIDSCRKSGEILEIMREIDPVRELGWLTPGLEAGVCRTKRS